MKFELFIIYTLLIVLSSCDPEPSGPESDCTLNGLYKLDYHAIDASKVFDLRSDPPLEIRNGTIEYDLGHQSFNILNHSTPVYPCSEYFIDTIAFPNETNAIVKILERDFQRLYTVARNDCQLALNSPEGDLYLQLTSGGDEISEKRFAIYNHSIAANGLDTFQFIEFRTGSFKSYEEIISQFSKDNPGMYDTVAVELVVNRTKE
jgi:hypothetical protein